MTWKSISMCFLAGVCSLLAGFGSVAIGDEKDNLNQFYRSVVQTIKKPAHLKELVALVEKNSAIAKRCLVVCGQKAQGQGDKAEALRLIYDELQAALFLSSKSPTCDQNSVLQILKVVTPEQDYDESIFFLDKLVKSCPRSGKAYQMLGDLYLKKNQCGMAIAQYKKAAEILGDEDSRTLLEEARKREKKLLAQSLTEEDVDRTLGPTKQIVRKAGGEDVEIENTVQILFGEWSSEIEGSFRTHLDVMGRWAQKKLPSNPGLRLVIEGHSDRRGDLTRNMRVSVDRAETVKTYLVQNFGIDPAQLETRGLGPNRPYSPDDNEAGWKLNRRVEFKKLESAK